MEQDTHVTYDNNAIFQADESKTYGYNKSRLKEKNEFVNEILNYKTQYNPSPLHLDACRKASAERLENFLKINEANNKKNMQCMRQRMDQKRTQEEKIVSWLSFDDRELIQAKAMHFCGRMLNNEELYVVAKKRYQHFLLGQKIENDETQFIKNLNQKIENKKLNMSPLKT